MIFGRSKEEIEFPKSLIVLDKVFEIDVEFSKKRSSSVNIKENKLIFKMSSYLSKKQALIDFNDLFLKISKKIEKTPEILEPNLILEIKKRGNFIFSGEKYYFEEKIGKRGVKLLNNTFYVPINYSSEQIRKSLIKILRKKYYDRIKLYLEVLNSSSYNFEINGFELKAIDSKWGHCTYDNIILLNLKLLNAPKEILDYVIFHELCHIKHKNHSSVFWNEVSRFCPNYKELRKTLKAKPPKLFVFEDEA